MEIAVPTKKTVTNSTEIVTEIVSYSIDHELIYTIFCVIGICCDFLIITANFRFKRMRTIPNTFLTNLIIADVCFLLLMAANYIIITPITGRTDVSINVSCVPVQLEIALYLAILYFVTLLTIDWVIAVYFQKYLEIYRNYYKIVITIIWIYSLLFWGVTTCLCFKTELIILSVGYNVSVMCVISLFIIIIQIYNFIQKIKGVPMDYPHLMLTLASTFILSRVPELMVFLFSGDVLLAAIFIYVTPLNTILNFFLLYLLNKDFQAYLRRFWNRADQGYMEAVNDFETHEQHEDQQFPGLS